jgi:hypothetical protein
LKNKRVRHGNRGGEKEKERKVVSTKPEIHMPYAPSKDEEAVETIQMSP